MMWDVGSYAWLKEPTCQHLKVPVALENTNTRSLMSCVIYSLILEENLQAEHPNQPFAIIATDCFPLSTCVNGCRPIYCWFALSPFGLIRWVGAGSTCPETRGKFGNKVDHSKNQLTFGQHEIKNASKQGSRRLRHIPLMNSFLRFDQSHFSHLVQEHQVFDSAYPPKYRLQAKLGVTKSPCLNCDH